jgi:opacity protein-like surface antigen
MKSLAVLAIAALLSTVAAFGQEAGKTVSRWESNLSIGYIGYDNEDSPPPPDVVWLDGTPPAGQVDDMNRHIAIIKSFWFYPFMPHVLALGLSFDYVTDDLPISINAALNVPTKTIVPFVSAGAGFSFSGSTLRNYGGGLKVRFGKKIGMIAEYRHYTIKKHPFTGGDPVTRLSHYYGAGIAYLY